MKYSTLEALVTKTLREARAHSPDVVQQMMMIAAHESGRGKHRRQLKADKPALSLWQIERPTFDTVMQYSARWPQYAQRCGYDFKSVKFEDIEHDDKLACVVARSRLSMDTRPIPSTPEAQAQYALKFWNAGGKAGAEKYLNDWLLWRSEG